jgi:hypothetical protein
VAWLSDFGVQKLLERKLTEEYFTWVSDRLDWRVRA